MSSLVGHNACIMRQAHKSQESHLHVRIDTSNSSLKRATLPKSPSRLQTNGAVGLIAV